MKSALKIVPAACLAFVLALGAMPASAQQQAAPTPGAIAAAKEILTLKNASAMYAGAVPGTVEKVKGTLIGPSHNDLGGQPDCSQAPFPTRTGRDPRSVA